MIVDLLIERLRESVRVTGDARLFVLLHELETNTPPDKMRALEKMLEGLTELMGETPERLLDASFIEGFAAAGTVVSEMLGRRPRRIEPASA